MRIKGLDGKGIYLVYLVELRLEFKWISFSLNRFGWGVKILYYGR